MKPKTELSIAIGIILASFIIISVVKLLGYDQLILPLLAFPLCVTGTWIGTYIKVRDKISISKEGKRRLSMTIPLFIIVNFICIIYFSHPIVLYALVPFNLLGIALFVRAFNKYIV